MSNTPSSRTCPRSQIGGEPAPRPRSRVWCSHGLHTHASAAHDPTQTASSSSCMSRGNPNCRSPRCQIGCATCCGWDAACRCCPVPTTLRTPTRHASPRYPNRRQWAEASLQTATDCSPDRTKLAQCCRSPSSRDGQQSRLRGRSGAVRASASLQRRPTQTVAGLRPPPVDRGRAARGNAPHSRAALQSSDACGSLEGYNSSSTIHIQRSDSCAAHPVMGVAPLSAVLGEQAEPRASVRSKGPHQRRRHLRPNRVELLGPPSLDLNLTAVSTSTSARHASKCAASRLAQSARSHGDTPKVQPPGPQQHDVQHCGRN
mmetsp:Transcript_31866/g.85179  ORF Transcript_31866/g.85179 Transcript_31866/m.85179 type:complete len:316 (+) Transcript_31866:290-1237(+)